jgi:hypothetical protein
MTMKTFDCKLDHHPLIRLEAESPEAAKAEYFRRYAISSSTADWHCGEAVAGSAAPVEPESWIKRRKELGTWIEPAKEAAGAPTSPPTTKAAAP